MRIRTIKPAFWANEKMSALPDFARLLAIGLLNYADDLGFFWANSLMIRGSLFPFEEDSSKVLKGLSQLASEGYIRLGKTADGRAVGHVVNFSKHQRVDKPQPSEIQSLAIFEEPSKNGSGTVEDQSALYRKGKEGKGKDLPPAPPEVVPPEETPTDGRHREICQRWGSAYQTAFEMKYMFATKDAATLKRFLSTNHESADAFLEVASQAWVRSRTDRFAKRCKEAATLHGLCTFYNEIRAELKSAGDESKGRALFA
jgi:hypothetical protein